MIDCERERIPSAQQDIPTQFGTGFQSWGDFRAIAPCCRTYNPSDHFNLRARQALWSLFLFAGEHLRIEAREKLSAFQPATLGHASRISGITPADITVIQVHMRKHYSARRRRESPVSDEG